MKIVFNQPTSDQPGTYSCWSVVITPEMTFDENSLGAYGRAIDEENCLHTACNESKTCEHEKAATRIATKQKENENIVGYVEFDTSKIEDNSEIKEINDFSEFFQGEQKAYWVVMPPDFVENLPLYITQNIKNPIDGEYPREFKVKQKIERLASFKWDKIPVPKEYKIPLDIWHSMIAAAKSGKNVLVVGPTGCGKTEIIKAAASAIGMNYEAFNLGAMSDPRSSLIGNMHFDKKTGTHFSESRFVKAFQTPNTLINLDEISRAGPPAFNILLPALDRQGYLALDETQEAKIVYRDEKVAMFATANIGMEYTGTMQLDAALVNRFALYLEFAFPSEEDEIDIILQRNPGVDKSVIDKFVKFANRQREETDKGNYLVAISTRMLIETGWALNQGFNRTEAFNSTIANHFSKVGGNSSDRAKVMQLLQAVGL